MIGISDECRDAVYYEHNNYYDERAKDLSRGLIRHI